MPGKRQHSRSEFKAKMSLETMVAKPCGASLPRSIADRASGPRSGNHHPTIRVGYLRPYGNSCTVCSFALNRTISRSVIRIFSLIT